ncbi:hypothetical protein GOBAR_DD32057 [Gossypium barbadense]|nr:hypothetical protein GOBAR_DD32057 [Gossypium barbadense]
MVVILENVNGEDAGEAKLNEKRGIRRLVLHWSEKLEKASRNKEVEEWVLDTLRPPKQLEQLFIENYGGAKSSTWIADSSFKNMLSLELRNCKNCKSLPSIGRLLWLKDLSISGLDQVHKIGAELFGENQSNAFASLESLCFDNMLNWEKWNLCEDDQQVSRFPSLRKLSIKRCPLLLGRLPTIIQSLQTLEIYECKRLVVSISCFPLLRKIWVEGCEELVDEGPLSVQKVTSLKDVFVSNISNFNISAERIMLRFANFETFCISGWKELGSLSQIGLRLVGHRFIEIVSCPQLVSLETEEERLQLDKIPDSNFPPALKELWIEYCVNLQYLVDEKENNNKPQDFLETIDLESIGIRGAEKIKSLPWGLDKLCHLQDIKLSRCPNLVSFEESGLPTTNLRVLSVEACENFKALPKCINNFTFVRELSVWECSADISFPEEGFPTNLTSLAISNAPKIYTSLVDWGFNRLTSLQELNISGIEG